MSRTLRLPAAMLAATLAAGGGFVVGYGARGIPAQKLLIEPAPPAMVQALASAQTEIHYAPAENLEKIDVDLIGEAGETIDIAAYVLTDAAVIEALQLAAERGVKVRLYRWPDERSAPPAIAVGTSGCRAAVDSDTARHPSCARPGLQTPTTTTTTTIHPSTPTPRPSPSRT